MLLWLLQAKGQHYNSSYKSVKLNFTELEYTELEKFMSSALKRYNNYSYTDAMLSYVFSENIIYRLSLHVKNLLHCTCILKNVSKIFLVLFFYFLPFQFTVLFDYRKLHQVHTKLT